MTTIYYGNRRTINNIDKYRSASIKYQFLLGDLPLKNQCFLSINERDINSGRFQRDQLGNGFGIHNAQTGIYYRDNLCNSYTMGCPPVRGYKPRVLANGLSYVQVDKHGITNLYHLHQCRPCTSRDISC